MRWIEAGTAVRALIMVEGRLLVEWYPPKAIAFLPGGRVNEGENLRQALARELKEELLPDDASIGVYLGSIEHGRREGERCYKGLQHFFEAHFAPSVGANEICAREPGRIIRLLALDEPEPAALKPPVLPGLIRARLSGETRPWKEIDHRDAHR